MTTKKPGQAKRKREADDERAAFIADMFAELCPNAMDELAGSGWTEHRLTAKRERDREREESRRGVRARVSGFVRSKGGFMVERRQAGNGAQWLTPSREDREMLERLGQLIEAAQPFEPAIFDWADDAAEQRARAKAGLVPEATLARVRAAYAAAFAEPPSRRWVSYLRAIVHRALRYRLAKGALPDSFAYAKTGRGIVAQIRQKYPDDVPRGLTGAQVDALLRTTTLGRGGGAGGKAKRNVDRALDALLRTLA